MTEHINLTPQYPGDAVRTQDFEREGELGDIRIQWYGDEYRPRGGPWKVAMFLTGRDVLLPGDTPKVEPEMWEWLDSRKAADEMFDLYVVHAVDNGWSKL